MMDGALLPRPRDAKPQIARRALRRVRAARRDAIAVAVRVMTQVRAAAHRLPPGRAGERRIAGRRLLVVRRREPVVTPLPYVAAHVMEAESVRLVGADRQRCGQPACRGLVWKHAAPDIASRRSILHQLIAPGVALSLEPASGRAFPFGLGRQ